MTDFTVQPEARKAYDEALRRETIQSLGEKDHEIIQLKLVIAGLKSLSERLTADLARAAADNTRLRETAKDRGVDLDDMGPEGAPSTSQPQETGNGTDTESPEDRPHDARARKSRPCRGAH